MVHVVERADGVLLAFGALPRPTDPREAKYALRSTLPPRAVDIRQERILTNVQPVRNQGGIGACAAFSSELAACLARDQQLLTPSSAPLHQGWLYYHARKKQGWEQQDSGSHLADNLGILMQGAPLASVFPYVQSALWSPPAELEAQERHDYVLSHRPFYPAERNTVEAVWSALDAGMPVVAAGYWPEAWFSPVKGVLPGGIATEPLPWGHAYLIFGCVPGYFLAQNSWGEAWTPDAGQNPVIGERLRPGQFLIPWEYAENGQIWEYRAVALEPVPAPRTWVYMQMWTRGKDGWDITPLETDLPADGAWVTVKTKREGEGEQIAIPFTRVGGPS